MNEGLGTWMWAWTGCKQEPRAGKSSAKLGGHVHHGTFKFKVCHTSVARPTSSSSLTCHTSEPGPNQILLLFHLKPGDLVHFLPRCL